MHAVVCRRCIPGHRLPLNQFPEGVQSLKKLDQNIFSLKNDAKYIIRSLIIWLIFLSFFRAHEHRFVKLIFVDRYTVTEQS